MDEEPVDGTVDLENGALHYLSAGTGPDLLILHHDIGPMGWTRFHRELARDSRVYALDLPGFGASPRIEWARHPRDLAAIVLAAARKLGLRKYMIAGLGFGGWVAAEMASFAWPELAGLLLVAPAGLKPDDGFIFDQMMEDPFVYLRMGFSDPAVYAEHVPEPRARPLKARLDECRESVARLSWKPYMYSYELSEVLREVQLPVMVVWGESDAIIPSSCANHWARVLPDCAVRLVPGVGHFLDLERPDLLAQFAAAGAAALTRKD